MATSQKVVNDSQTIIKPRFGREDHHFSNISGGVMYYSRFFPRLDGGYGIKPTEFMLIGILKTFAWGDKTNAGPTIETIAAIACTSPRTIRYWIKSALDAGILSIESGKESGTANEYEFGHLFDFCHHLAYVDGWYDNKTIHVTNLEVTRDQAGVGNFSSEGRQFFVIGHTKFCLHKNKSKEEKENTYQPQASELPVSDKKSVAGVESEETGVDSNQVQPSSGEKPKTPQTAKGKPAEKIITLSPNNGGSAAPDLPADMLGKLAALRQWLADTPQPPHERAFKGFTHHLAYKAMETVLKATSHPAKRDGMQLGSVLHQLWKIENSDVFKVLDFLEWYHIKTNYTLPKKWDAWFGYADGRKGNYMLWLEEKAKRAAPVVSDMALRADENCPRCHGKGSVVKSSPDKYAVEMIFEAEPCSCLQRRKLDSLAS